MYHEAGLIGGVSFPIRIPGIEGRGKPDERCGRGVRANEIKR
jgi:hypothetical protein